MLVRVETVIGHFRTLWNFFPKFATKNIYIIVSNTRLQHPSTTSITKIRQQHVWIWNLNLILKTEILFHIFDFDSVREQILKRSIKKFFFCVWFIFAMLVVQSILASLLVIGFSEFVILQSFSAINSLVLGKSAKVENISIKLMNPVSRPSSELPGSHGVSCFSGDSVFIVFPKSIHLTMGSSRH